MKTVPLLAQAYNHCPSAPRSSLHFRQSRQAQVCGSATPLPSFVIEFVGAHACTLKRLARYLGDTKIRCRDSQGIRSTPRTPGLEWAGGGKF